MKSGNSLHTKISTIIWSLISSFVCFTVTQAFAETSALRGLGEPAAPDSMAHPDKLGPASPAESSPTSNSPVQPSPSSETNQPVLLKPIIQKTGVQPLYLSDAVEYAQRNYPAIMKAQAQMEAARQNIKVQKLNEYLPDSLFQFQEVMASHNKLTQIIYGSPVFPANPGPGFNSVTMDPRFFSGAGFNLDWAPIDFGLHKARIQLAKEQYGQTKAQYGATKLDIQIAAANAFLDVVEAIQQVRAAEENVSSFAQFSAIVGSQVSAQLKAGADAALAEAQLANARNQLLRARLNYKISRTNLANSLGLAGTPVDVVDTGLATVIEKATIQQSTPVFEDVPILQATKATVLTALAQRKVLNKEYAPVLHFLGGVQQRGAGLDTKGRQQTKQLNGFLPAVPNYQVAMIVNWNFLDWFRLKAEKRVQDQRIVAQREEYNLVLQNLKSEDERSRARVETAIEIAHNMRPQVVAAQLASQQAQARYQVGLSSSP